MLHELLGRSRRNEVGVYEATRELQGMLGAEVLQKSVAQLESQKAMPAATCSAAAAAAGSASQKPAPPLLDAKSPKVAVSRPFSAPLPAAAVASLPVPAAASATAASAAASAAPATLPVRVPAAAPATALPMPAASASAAPAPAALPVSAAPSSSAMETAAAPAAEALAPPLSGATRPEPGGSGGVQPPELQLQLSPLEQLVSASVDPERRAAFVALPPEQRIEYCSKLLGSFAELSQICQKIPPAPVSIGKGASQASQSKTAAERAAVSATAAAAAAAPAALAPPPSGATSTPTQPQQTEFEGVHDHAQLSPLEKLVSASLNPQQRTAFVALSPEQRLDYCSGLLASFAKLRQMHMHEQLPPISGSGIQFSSLDQLVFKKLSPEYKTKFLALNPEQRQGFCIKLLKINPELRRMFQQLTRAPAAVHVDAGSGSSSSAPAYASKVEAKAETTATGPRLEPQERREREQERREQAKSKPGHEASTSLSMPQPAAGPSTAPSTGTAGQSQPREQAGAKQAEPGAQVATTEEEIQASLAKLQEMKLEVPKLRWMQEQLMQQTADAAERPQTRSLHKTKKVLQQLQQFILVIETPYSPTRVPALRVLNNLHLLVCRRLVKSAIALQKQQRKLKQLQARQLQQQQQHQEAHINGSSEANAGCTWRPIVDPSEPDPEKTALRERIRSLEASLAVALQVERGRRAPPETDVSDPEKTVLRDRIKSLEASLAAAAEERGWQAPEGPAPPAPLAVQMAASSPPPTMPAPAADKYEISAKIRALRETTCRLIQTIVKQLRPPSYKSAKPIEIEASSKLPIQRIN
eukprot:tig00000057_g22.t2